MGAHSWDKSKKEENSKISKLIWVQESCILPFTHLKCSLMKDKMQQSHIASILSIIRIEVTTPYQINSSIYIKKHRYYFPVVFRFYFSIIKNIWLWLSFVFKNVFLGKASHIRCPPSKSLQYLFWCELGWHLHQFYKLSATVNLPCI